MRKLYEMLTPKLVRQQVDMDELLDRVVPASGKGLNLGSKAVRLERPDKPGFTWINVDKVAGPNVDVVCDVLELSRHEQFRVGGTVDVVVISATLQYVSRPGETDAPKEAVQQIAHVLKPGGIVVCNTPFLQQVCPEPGSVDVHRFSPERLREMYGSQFDILELGVAIGVGSAMASAAYSVADQCVQNRAASALLRLVVGWAVKPLIWLPAGGINTAGGHYLIGRRKVDDARAAQSDQRPSSMLS